MRIFMKILHLMTGHEKFIIQRMISTFSREGAFMSLKEYLVQNKVDEIEDDEEFCEREYDLIGEYLQNNIASEEDVEEVERRGYFMDYFVSTEE